MNENATEEERANSNTPFQNTTISLDYLAFTVPYSEKNQGYIHEFLKETDTKILDYGGLKYSRSAIIFDGGRVYWHPERREMGIHFRLGAKALSCIEMSPLCLINKVRDWGGVFKRVDLAYDDFEGDLDMDEMYEMLERGDVVTRWRKALRTSGINLGESEKAGDTVSVGARSSQAFLRIYDKKLEQEGKGTDLKNIAHWVRVELELKGPKADYFATLMGDSPFREDNQGTGELCTNLLYGLLDFKKRNESETNKSRWKTVGWWSKFLMASDKLMLAMPKKERSIEKSKKWIATSVSSTLAMIVLSEPDDKDVSGYDFIIDCISLGSEKMSKEQQNILNLYNEQQKEKRGDNILPD
jgi:phage replication initiation protein